jgi:hypothetical protein
VPLAQAVRKYRCTPWHPVAAFSQLNIYPPPNEPLHNLLLQIAQLAKDWAQELTTICTMWDTHVSSRVSKVRRHTCPYRPIHNCVLQYLMHHHGGTIRMPARCLHTFNSASAASASTTLHCTWCNQGK